MAGGGARGDCGGGWVDDRPFGSGQNFEWIGEWPGGNHLGGDISEFRAAAGEAD